MLRKTVKLRNGITAEYWRVENINVDRAKQRAFIDLYGYVDPEAESVGKMPIKVADLIYPVEYSDKNEYDYTEWFSPAALEGEDLYQMAYTYIKEHIPEFEGAEDC